MTKTGKRTVRRMGTAMLLAALVAFPVMAGGTQGGKYGTDAQTGATKNASAKQARVQEKEQVQQNAQGRVDQRQEWQTKRIEHGVKWGYLTEEELARLKAQQKQIVQMEAGFTGDGRLTRDEAKQLFQTLNDASLLIWTEKHDQDGKTMPVYRLGKDVMLNPDVARRLQDPNLTREEARAFTKDFRRAVELRRALASPTLSDPERVKLQAEYDALMERYFVVKTAK